MFSCLDCSSWEKPLKGDPSQKGGMNKFGNVASTESVSIPLNLWFIIRVFVYIPDSTTFGLYLLRGHHETCLYNFDPLKPHFYIVKLEFTGVYVIFLISTQNMDCGYALEPHHRGGSNEYPQSMFWTEWWNISEFIICKFSFFGCKIFSTVKPV